MSHLSADDAVESAARFEAMLHTTADFDDGPWSDSYQVRAIRTEGQLMIAELDITDQTYPLGSLASPLVGRGRLYSVGGDVPAD